MLERLEYTRGSALSARCVGIISIWVSKPKYIRYGLCIWPWPAALRGSLPPDSIWYLPFQQVERFLVDAKTQKEKKRILVSKKFLGECIVFHTISLSPVPIRNGTGMAISVGYVWSTSSIWIVSYLNYHKKCRHKRNYPTAIQFFFK